MDQTTQKLISDSAALDKQASQYSGVSYDYSKALGGQGGTISSASLIPQTPTNFQTPQYDTPTMPPDIYKPEPLVPTPQEQKQSAVSDRLQEINTSLSGEAAFRTDQLGANGIPELQKTQDDLYSQLQLLQANAKNIPDQMQNESVGRGITTSALQPLTMAKLRENSINANIISAQLAGTQNKIATARQHIEDAVLAKFGPLKAEADALIKNLQLIINDPRTSIQDKNRANAQLAIQEQKKADIAKQEEAQSKIWSIGVQAAQNGATSEMLQQIQRAKTPEEALMIANTAGLLKDAGAQPASVQEYEYAKANGYIGTFTQYQNEDANRKATVARAGAGNNMPSSNALVTGLSPEQSKTILGLGLSSVQAENVAGIFNGTRPPLSGFGANSKEGMAVTAGLNALGYDLTKATEDWTAMQKRISTMNGTQQVRLEQAINFSYDSLDIIEQLNNQWQGGGFPILNKANLIAAKNGLYGADAQSLATRLDAQINDLTSELGTVYKGGNSSTDESLKLAAGNLSSSWSQKTLSDAISLARVNLQIRKNSIANSSVIPGNNYSEPVNTQPFYIDNVSQSTPITSDSQGFLSSTWNWLFGE